MKTSALEWVEEAVSLLRDLHSGEWLRYALGAVPLNLAVLLLVRDVTAGYGREFILRDSMVCTLGFWWAGFWKARFAATLSDRLSGTATARRNAIWECVSVQGVLQSFRLVLWPLAAISIVPMPWFSSLFRQVSVESNRPGMSIRVVLRAAAGRATYGGGRNWTVLLICTAGGLMLFANFFFLLLMLPRLLRTFTGTENDWTRYSAGGNISLFAIAAALTWLVIDPVVQAHAAVESFYFEARRDGRDLLARLRKAAAAALLCFLLLNSGRELRAAEAKPALTPADVRRGVEEATGSREFAWVHRTAPKASSDDWFGSRILRDWQRLTDAIGSFFDKLGGWLNQLFGRRTQIIDFIHREPHADARRLQWLFYAGVAFCVTVAAVFLLHRRKQKTSPVQGEALAAATSPSVEDLLATERPQEEWLALARDFAGKGDWRLAIRAMYLANLSYLGAAELLRITKSKSNAMYERELRNRCRMEPVCVAFARSNRDYERVWYGMHEVTPEVREDFEQCVSAIRAHG